MAGSASILAGAAGGTITDSGADGINPETSPETVAAYLAQLVLAEWDTARLLAVPVLAMVIGALASRAPLPRWFRQLSVGFAVLLVLALVPSLGPAGGLAVVGALWVVVASVLFAAERPKASGRTPASRK